VTATAGAVLFGFRGSTARPTKVWEIQLFNVTAPTTSGALGLVVATGIGSGAITGNVGQSRNRGAVASTAQAWTNFATTLPTVGAVGTSLRRMAIGATIGNGIIWTFDAEPVELALGGAIGGDLCLINLNATAPGTYDFSFIYDE
jgi:hypothetical protein